MRIIHSAEVAVAAAGLFAVDYAGAAPISKSETIGGERLPPPPPRPKIGGNRGVGA
jgi:hypothetical protein